MDALFLKLHPADNVLISVDNIPAGHDITLDGRQYAVVSAVPRYFKIAAREIRKGEKIIKCGMAIGVAMDDVEVATLVHTHNIRSDYMDSFTRKNEDTNI
ncbi:MAG: UxaA family hydrolase [Cyclobacteriaceae bacterium]